MLDNRRAHDCMHVDGAIVSWSDSAEAALSRMRGLGCDHLAVVDATGVIGMCERQQLLGCAQRGTWLGSVAVADLTRRGPFWCRADDPVEKVLHRMERLKTDTLAVIDAEGHVLGTISRSQLLTGKAAPELAAH